MGEGAAGEYRRGCPGTNGHPGHPTPRVALEGLEPCDGRPSCGVLRGLGTGNSSWLPGLQDGVTKAVECRMCREDLKCSFQVWTFRGIPDHRRDHTDAQARTSDMKAIVLILGPVLPKWRSRILMQDSQSVSIVANRWCVGRRPPIQRQTSPRSKTPAEGMGSICPVPTQWWFGVWFPHYRPVPAASSRQTW